MARWCGIEREWRREGRQCIAGIDEVGRGPLAGPVVACAIVMPLAARAISGVADSKQLSAGERERLARLIRERAVALALGAASVREIATLNIYHATVLAMRRALKSLAVEPDGVLVDGRPVASLGVAHRAVVHGDARCYSVACASIVAKVVRDRLMCSLGRRHPAFGWETNAGYGTPEHVRALHEAGLTAHHRALFCETAMGGTDHSRERGVESRVQRSEA